MADAAVHEPDTPMTREEFLAWVEQQPHGRFERIDGIVVAMAPERVSHNRRKGAARDALRRAIREAGLVFADGLTVHVENSDFVPDALLRCGPRLGGDPISVPDPLVLVEARPTAVHATARPSCARISKFRRCAIILSSGRTSSVSSGTREHRLATLRRKSSPRARSRSIRRESR